jgi:hypothetical protein
MGRKPTGGGNDERRVRLDDAALAAWFLEGKTAKEISQIVGCSIPPIQNALKRLGLRRPAKQRLGVLSGSRNPAWSGGRHIRSDGYVRIWTPDGQRLEHQVVMESKLGRPLVDGEVVHHIDEIKSNNDPMNLQLTSQAEHIRKHLPEMHRARYGK